MAKLVAVALLFGVLLFSVSSSPSVWWNGLNVAWDNFGYDIGTPMGLNTTFFQSFYESCEENKINAARFWLHCDGRASPLFNEDGSVSGLSSTFLSDLSTLVGMAEKSNVVVLVTLWSFDMCNQEVPTGLHVDLISNSTKTQSYLDNALQPILRAMTDFPNIVWEVINEPEWCINETPPSTTTSVSLSDMQRFVSMIVNEIHQNSNQKVTVGSASLKWNSDVSPAVGNWWSDSSLQQGAYLDFYQGKRHIIS